MSRGTDSRALVIEDAVGLLQMLPTPDRIVWPAEPGDLEAIDEALRWMSGWLPEVKAARRQHKRLLRDRQAGVVASIKAGRHG